MNRLKAFFHLCWVLGHDHEPIVDTEARRAFNRCTRCGHEHQYDFQASLPLEWIGFASGDNKCPLCMGWKPKAWKFCSSGYCELNPKGPIRLV